MKGNITYGTVKRANWKTASLHQFGSMVHVITDLAIHAELALNPDANLLVPLNPTNTDVKPLHVQKIIYLPAPFAGLFLDR